MTIALSEKYKDKSENDVNSSVGIHVQGASAQAKQKYEDCVRERAWKQREYNEKCKEQEKTARMVEDLKKEIESKMRERKLLGKDVVLHHVDFKAAENPRESGRPLELFIDASDIAWCATLCQRLTSHGPSKLISCMAHCFNDTQPRWSAMERELYAVWQGVAHLATL